MLEATERMTWSRAGTQAGWSEAKPWFSALSSPMSQQTGTNAEGTPGLGGQLGILAAIRHISFFVFFFFLLVMPFYFFKFLIFLTLKNF